MEEGCGHVAVWAVVETGTGDALRAAGAPSFPKNAVLDTAVVPALDCTLLRSSKLGIDSSEGIGGLFCGMLSLQWRLSVRTLGNVVAIVGVEPPLWWDTVGEASRELLSEDLA